jgi:hypothetical protein
LLRRFGCLTAVGCLATAVRDRRNEPVARRLVLFVAAMFERHREVAAQRGGVSAVPRAAQRAKGEFARFVEPGQDGR